MHALPRSNEAGFALLDMLVGLSVLALLMTGLVAVVSFVTHQQVDLREREETRESVLAAARLMRTLIDGAPVLPGHDRGGGIIGSESSFVIHSTGPAVLALPQPNLFELAAVPGIKGGDLVVSWDGPHPSGEARRRIVRNLKQASFDYLIRDAKHSVRWHSNVSGEEGRVEAVRLTLHPAEQGSLIEIVTPIRNEISALCANSTTVRSCRAQAP